MFHSLASARGERCKDLHDRLKRNRDGTLVPVRYQQGPSILATVKPLMWNDLAQALLAMTQYAFSSSGFVFLFDFLSGDRVREMFHWSSLHQMMKIMYFLPSEMQVGLAAAQRSLFWTSTLETLLEYSPFAWKFDEYYAKEFLKHVGTLWKTLEVAMNNADLQFDFIIFFCSQLMDGLSDIDCGGMSFVPLLNTAPSPSASSSAGVQPLAFTKKVRYKAQGRVPSKKYPGKKLTVSQRESLTLLRPFLAAHGQLPSANRSSQELSSSSTGR